MHYSRLKLTVQAPLKLKDITYKFVVKNKITKKTTNFEGRFDENGLTIWYEINNLNTSLAYIIYLRGTVLQTISAQAYLNKKTQSVYKLKTTSEITKKTKENIKKIQIDDREVAWYLIKKSEPVFAWTQRIFKKPLSRSEWDILKTNNAHLPNLVSMGVLQPGQVIILSNTKTAKELPEYKKYAQQAQKTLTEMQKDRDFDAEFFAQNYEFFYDAITNKNAKIVNKDILENDDHLTIKFKEKESFLEQKIAVDATVTLLEGNAHRIYTAHGQLAEKLAEERAKGSTYGNPKNFNLFKKKYSHLYTQIQSESTQKFLRYDQSIKTDNMRRILSQSAPSRDKNYKGGIKEYSKKMVEIGKFSKQLKLVGYLAIASDVLKAGFEIAEANPEDRAKTTVVETAKIAGGFGAGVVVSAIVVGVATGGAGLVVLGVVAVSGAFASKAFGDMSGAVAGNIYDIAVKK